MTGVEAATLLGACLGKSLLKGWLESRGLGEACSGGIADIVNAAITGKLERRRVGREFKQIAVRAQARLSQLFEVEASNLDASGTAAVARAVEQLLDQTPVTAQLLTKLGLLPSSLKRHMLRETQHPTQGLNEAESALFWRVLDEVSEQLSVNASQLSQFAESVSAEVLQGNQRIEEKLDRMVSFLVADDVSNSPGIVDVQARVLRQQIEVLSDKVRSIRDSESDRLLSKVEAHLASMSFRQAIQAGEELENWLGTVSLDLSAEMHGRALLLMADLALVSTLEDENAKACVAKAEEYCHRAQSAFGPTIRQDDADRVLALTAKICAIKGDPAAALRALDGMETPRAISLRLALMIETEEFGRAKTLLKERPWHEKWADLAIVVFVETQSEEQVRGVLKWAEGIGGDVLRRCALRQGEAILRQFFRREEGGSDRRPEQGSPVLTEALAALGPLLTVAESPGCVLDGILAEGLAVAVSISHYLGDLKSRHRFSVLLGSATPVHFGFARAVLAGYVMAPTDLPGRLRDDYPEARKADFLAACVQGRLGEYIPAVETLRSLVPLADAREKQELCECLLDFSGPLPEGERQDVRAFVEQELGAENYVVELLKAAELVANGNAEAAGEEIQRLRADRDPRWWQIQSQYLRLKENLQGAAEALATACELAPAPSLNWSLFELAQDANRPDLEERALVFLKSEVPVDPAAWSLLGSLYIDQDRFREAIPLFRRLYDDYPAESAFAMNLSLCLRNDGFPEQALPILDQLCHETSPQIRAVLGRAQLLHEVGQSDRAFQSLQSLQDQFFDNPDFLLAYVGFAYAAGQDASATEAFARLAQLDKQGEVPADKLKSYSVDEVADLIKASADHQRTLDLAVLHGRMPWLVAEQVRGHSPVPAWNHRTRNLLIGDHLIERAGAAIYATNGFALQRDSDDQSQLKPIECPPPGADVVVDLTAMITLLLLGLLDQASGYFGRMLVPAGYVPWLAEAAGSLADPQPSRAKVAEEIKEVLDNNGIRELSGESGSTTVFDEFGEGTSTGFGLSDLAHCLNKAGHISAEQAKLLSDGRRGHSTPAPQFSEVASAPVLFGLGTLCVVVEAGLLTPITCSLDVCLSSGAVEELSAIVRSARHRGRLVERHRKLMGLVQGDHRFERIAAPGSAAKTQDAHVCRVLLASECAIERDLPLMMDDRVGEVIVLSGRNKTASAGPRPKRVFGTAALLNALGSQGNATMERVARSFVQLVRWRYRFILPSRDVLVHLVNSHRGEHPNPAMCDVARYIQDCMRDPGLFGGTEPTTPPQPMAVRCLQAWVNVLMEVLMELWCDPNVSDEVSEKMTEWVAQEALPQPPMVLNAAYRARLEDILPELALTVAAYASVDKDVSSANRALRSIARALGISDSEYVRTIGEAVNG